MIPSSKKNGPLVLLSGMLLLFGIGWAETVDQIPNPRVQSGSFVADSAGILGPEYIRLIDTICQTLKSGTGAELAVVTVRNLAGITLEDFAEKLFRRFAIGEKGKDNGLLLLFSLEDHVVHLEVGYGLESVITDAKASQLLDQQALPLFGENRFGQGIYLACREAAHTVAQAANITLTFTPPQSWPAQVSPPPVQAESKKSSRWEPVSASLIMAAGLIGFVVLGLLLTMLRIKSVRGLAARQKAIGGGKVFVVLIWILAVIGFFVIFGLTGQFLPPLIASLATPLASTFTQAWTAKLLRRRLDSYRLTCPACGHAMDLEAEEADDQLLSTAEQAEEQAGGMNYEIWKCPECQASEKLAVKMGKARTCPKCRRRTLTSSRITLVSATTSQGGQIRITDRCQNPDCNYSHEVERSTMKLSSTSGSGSSGSSSRSSFGGGRSGGGGATKHW